MTVFPEIYVIMTPSLHSGDAVGNDILSQRDALLRYKPDATVEVYAENCDACLSGVSISDSKLLELIVNPNCVVIYHFSVYWARLELYLDLAAKVYIRYHSLTPPKFFSGIDPGSEHATSLGISQLSGMTAKYQNLMYIATSEYTAQELRDLSVPVSSIDIVAPLLDPEVVSLKRGALSEGSREKKEADTLRVLFVGRVVPNKRHDLLIDVCDKYVENFGIGSIEVSVVGSLSPSFAKYYSLLESKLANSRIGSSFSFKGKISRSELVAEYKSADVFLCLSEHEGFCVPLVEAQSFGVPVVAWKRAAIADTLGVDQLVFLESAPDNYAYALRRLFLSRELRLAIAKNGFRNLKRFEPEVLERKFCSVLSTESLKHDQWKYLVEEKKLPGSESQALEGL